MTVTRQRRLLFILIALLVAGVSTLVKQQSIKDYLALRGYTPPAAVSQLAREDTMTAAARHVFYVNRPSITSGTDFASHCPSGSEKTIILGCYVGPDRGIFLYDVTDSRLSGVEQVTAAHEMLHAAYRRLSGNERQKIDAMLTDYYNHGLQDQRIKATIDQYRESEPDDVVNEMHSIFGTEVAALPAPLEAYYRQYFTNRSAVTAYAATYQTEFTSRQTKVSQYDAQLKSLKTDISSNETTLTTERQQISTQSAALESARQRGDIATYNSGVDAYNTAVNAYNTRRSQLESQIDQYNQLVAARNAVVLEEQQLTQALSNTAKEL